MEKKELRIGNYIRYRDEWDCEVMTIGSYFETHNKDLTDRLHGILCGSDDSNDYNPIPITEEWLLKFGFNYTNDEWIVLFWVNRRVVFTIEYIGKIFIEAKTRVHIKYVHQLQNLYFALAGEELSNKKTP